MQLRDGFAFLSLALVAAATLDAQGTRTRDSAGVRIIENPSRVTAPVRFALGTTPLMDVGGLDDNTANEFNHRQGYLRGVLLSNGDLVVTDVNRLHFYDQKGKRKAIVGRDGDGPGEFRYITSICVTRGDTLVVSDNRNRRVSILDGKGTFVRNNVHPDGGSPAFDSCLGDGTYLLHKIGGPPRGNRTVVVARYRLDGAFVDSLGTFQFGSLDMSTQREFQLVAAGTSVFYADELGDVRVTNAGRISIIRTADKPVEISMEEREKGWRATIPNNTSPEEVTRRMDLMRSMPADKYWPVHGRASVDADGRLWVQDYFRVGTGWTVFDATGTMVGRMTLPATKKRFQVIGFGKDRVLVARTDDDDALHMTVYPITRVP